jgi:hypothetical protein
MIRSFTCSWHTAIFHLHIAEVLTQFKSAPLRVRHYNMAQVYIAKVKYLLPGVY